MQYDVIIENEACEIVREITELVKKGVSLLLPVYWNGKPYDSFLMAKCSLKLISHHKMSSSKRQIACNILGRMTRAVRVSNPQTMEDVLLTVENVGIEL
jgi:hypothetical protein